MAYEDTKCACGDKKPTDTMLCDACNTHLSSRREMAEYQDPALRVDYRRSAAIILVSLARRRKRECANAKAQARSEAELPDAPGSAPNRKTTP